MSPSIATVIQMTPQARRVLLHLETYGSIESITAQSLYGITRLPARIHELRQAGFVISNGVFETLKGTKLTDYSLQK